MKEERTNMKMKGLQVRGEVRMIWLSKCLVEEGGRIGGEGKNTCSRLEKSISNDDNALLCMKNSHSIIAGVHQFRVLGY